ncbi:ATP-binding protein [Dyella tabacisoli]|uniref:ATP-binding protein n=1 Tax=Dyella tabacisoli TaxID=2282381 RepID=A0A369UHT1_9GAMM|nr:ATP-binding protein [Dyella tabacisoli]RDD80106.1 ATP-binding protein [Dyella tabacisoli]
MEHANQVIYLEGAEDFDIHKNGSVLTVQVRRTSSPISLGVEKARTALEHFWSLASRSPATIVEYHYLTTSTIALEQDADFDGLAGIDAWTTAQTNEQLAAKLTTYLVSKLPTDSQLRAFLAQADAHNVQQYLIRRFRWLTHRPDIDAVKQSVTDRIGELLRNQRRSAGMATAVCKWLESYFWEVVIRNEAEQRRLTLGDLHRLVDAATNPLLALGTAQLPHVLDANNPGRNLLNLLARSVPPVPSPLLMRRALCDQLTSLINQRKSVLVTGTVGKGKTTLVQVVLGTLAASSQWVDLAEAEPVWEKLLFRELAAQMDDSNFPTVIILDDLNLSPGQQKAYGAALADLLRRAEATGRSIVLTAQGESSASVAQQRFTGVEIVDVLEISIEEAKALCIDHGCPDDVADLWSVLITAKTGGHPKLVQIMLDELVHRNWPLPQLSEMSSASQGIVSARQATRQLLSDTVSTSDAELLYHASTCLVLMHRSILIRLAELVGNNKNAGDVIDRFTGKWIECIEGEWYRTTALLSGSAKDVWSEEDQAKAHARLHTAIQHKSPLSPAEAGALLYHAYFSKDDWRLAHTALKLQTIDSKEARQEVEQRYLLWLPYLAIGSGQQIANNPYAAVILRGLQFKVATTLDADVVPSICDRWVEETNAVDVEALQPIVRAHMWLAVGLSECEKVPHSHRLQAATGLLTLQDEPKHIAEAMLATIFDKATGEPEFPTTATPTQFVLLNVARSVEGIAGIDTLLSWLNTTNDASRGQFEDVLGWPITQTLGAFVQATWSRHCESTKDWSPWIVALDRVDACAKRWGLHRLGREAAKAKAIILAEYLSDATTALTCLQQAEADFGPSGILLEQWANLCYHQHQDEKVLQIWLQLSQDGLADVFFDPFAARRAGISAGRLARWNDAQEIFYAAASRLGPDSMSRVRFGLMVDAALATSHTGNQVNAASLLAEAVVALPIEAAGEDDPQWEAVQRIAVEVCRLIEHRVGYAQARSQTVELGRASAPNVFALDANAGQQLRTELTQAQALRLAATLGIWPIGADTCLASLEESRHLLVQLPVSETRLSLAYARGAGEGFIPSLLQFYKSLHFMMIHRSEGPGYEIDATEWSRPVTLPDAWFGYLIAGVLCSGHALLSHLALWLTEANSHVGNEDPLSQAISRLLDGAARSSDGAQRTVRDAAEDGLVRLGASATWMLDRPNAAQLFELQQLAAYPLVSDFVRVRQELFNHHVAKTLAHAWQNHAASGQFQFVSPRTTVPALTH